MKSVECDAYSQIKEARTELVFPYLRDIVRNLSPSRVLDLGCGPGLWLRLAAESLTKTTFIGCDTDPRMRDAALRHTKGLPNIPCIVNSTKNIQDASLDAICHTAVVMTLRTQKALGRFYREIARTLARNGVALGVETHPCFREVPYAGFSTDFKDKNYLAPQTKFTVALQGLEQTENLINIFDTHWPLMANFNAMIAANLRPIFLLEFSDLSEKRGSPWLLWGAVKNICPEQVVRKYRNILLRRARLETLA